MENYKYKVNWCKTIEKSTIPQYYTLGTVCFKKVYNNK